MRFVLEISEKEKEAFRKAGRDVKNSFKKIKEGFKVRVVKDTPTKKPKRKR